MSLRITNDNIQVRLSLFGQPLTDTPTSESGMQSTKHGLVEFVRALKTFSSRKINELRQTQGTSIWQRNYYEHIIRNDDDYFKTVNYIKENPARWGSEESLEK